MLNASCTASMDDSWLRNMIFALGALRAGSCQLWCDGGTLEIDGGEESIFSWGTEKNLPGASYELPDTAARIKIPRNEIFPTACRIPIWPFVVIVKAGQRTPSEGLLQEKAWRNI